MGQQTCSWYGELHEYTDISLELKWWDRSSSTIDNLMGTYEAFIKNKAFSSSRPIFRAIRKLMVGLNGDDSLGGMVWSNVYTVDQDKVMPKLHPLREAILKIGMLRRQIDILKPQAIVFLTGHNYDKVIEEYVLTEYRFTEVATHSYKEMAQLQVVRDGTRAPHYRIHHPGYLVRRGNEFNLILNDLVGRIRTDYQNMTVQQPPH